MIAMIIGVSCVAFGSLAIQAQQSQPAPAATVAPKAPGNAAPAPTAKGEAPRDGKQIPVGPAFSTLTPYQAEVLRPLQPVWDELGEVRKRKWIEIANRLPTLTDDEKSRVIQRMQEWASLSPEQRRQARDNFSGAMNRTSAERQAQWEEYQKLSPEARQALIDRAQAELRQKREAAAGSGPVGAAATTRPAMRPQNNSVPTDPAK